MSIIPPTMPERRRDAPTTAKTAARSPASPPGQDRAALSAVDPAAAAKTAGLRYVTDAMPGIRRVRAGRGFRYVDAAGQPVRDRTTLERIKALGIPPAWTDVWICPLANGHLQATGRDARGRKQYRYHPRWREVRDETKFNRLLAFGRALPALRQRVAADLARPGLPREKVLAAVVRLLEQTMIRIGNAEYARSNDSFGLTTMRDDHVEVAGSTLCFSFRGKSGKEHSVDLRDRRLAGIVKRCRDLPGQELFQYLDETGAPHTIDSADVNAYLREATGEDFTAKDFRTWAGTVLCARELQAAERPESDSDVRHRIVEAIKSVASCLGNTPTICRKFYVHPSVIEAYLAGTLSSFEPACADLPPEEALILALLECSGGESP